ncbi:type II toxin-antitoxin system VapC family toxin [Marinitenerispora sediminis]|uniref:type II toxin-antitoxin system VapC family toxin n=1 Tax=Marinitenerispora sediminis TaxID=1931232 RepID=UPI001F24BFC1|nr:PIN domain-containing protein [Marinitenerispora sediminis]
MIVTLLDTGVLWAALDTSDKYHPVCAGLLTSMPGQILLPSPVVTETALCLESKLGPKAESDLLDFLVQSDIEIVELDRQDLVCASSIIRHYASLRIGFVDASVIAVAQRLDITRIATLDRRHFTTVRPTHTDTFTLLPEAW